MKHVSTIDAVVADANALVRVLDSLELVVHGIPVLTSQLITAG